MIGLSGRELATGRAGLGPAVRRARSTRLWLARLAALTALIALVRPALAAEVGGRTPGVRITAAEQSESAQVQVPGATITVQPGQPPAPTGDTVDLSGSWKFKGDWVESGLSEGWQKPEYDDTSWKDLQVPASWEEQGIVTPNPRWRSEQPDDGYNGYAWYRKHFTVPADWAGVPVTIEIGAIDDLDWTYLNGQLIGSTTEPNKWDDPREYSIPPGLLRPGADNVIAVRVCDRAGPGGITTGPVVLEKGGVEAAPPAPGRYTRQTQEVVRIGGGVTIPADQKVNGDVVAVGGSADISGYVTGSVVAVGGSVRARPASRIEGDAVAVGGEVDRAEGAYIGGQQVTAGMGFPWRPDWGQVVPRRFRAQGGFFSGLLIWAFIALLSVLLFRHRLEVMADALPLHPGRAAGWGLVGFALTPTALVMALLAEVFVIVILAITIVGIMLIPAVAVAMVGMVLAPGAVLLIGIAGVFLSLGRAIASQLGRPDARPIWAILIGVAVVCIGGLIPVIGSLLWITVAIFGFGVALMTGVGAGEQWSYRRLGRRGRRERPDEPEPADVAAPAPVVAPAAAESDAGPSPAVAPASEAGSGEEAVGLEPIEGQPVSEELPPPGSPEAEQAGSQEEPEA